MEVDVTSHPGSPGNVARDRFTPSTRGSSTNLEDELVDEDEIEDDDRLEDEDKLEDGDTLEDEESGDGDEGNGFDGGDEEDDDISEGKPCYEVPDDMVSTPHI